MSMTPLAIVTASSRWLPSRATKMASSRKFPAEKAADHRSRQSKPGIAVMAVFQDEDLRQHVADGAGSICDRNGASASPRVLFQ